jgi:hypothetical protein
MQNARGFVLTLLFLSLTACGGGGGGSSQASNPPTPYMDGGLIVQWAATRGLTLGLHLHDALQAGGKVTERPCYDGFERQFHCGTGLPWTDAQAHLRDRLVTPLTKLSVNWRF